MENLLFRKQIEILMRNEKRLNVNNRDRLFFVVLSKLLSHWGRVFLIYKPETLLRLLALGDVLSTDAFTK